MRLQWNKEEIDILKQKHEIMFCSEIQEKYFPYRTFTSVMKKMINLGLNSRRFSKQEKEIIEKYYGKISCSELYKMLPKRSKDAINHFASRNKIKGNQSIAIKKYSCNENYFSEPTLDNCFWAGFISADGCVYKYSDKTRSDRLVIDLNYYDKEILVNLKRVLECDNPITDCEYEKNHIYKTKYYKMNYLSISSNQLCSDLNKHWNITPRKSLTMQPPQNYISGDLGLSYAIGLLDGDGCISMNNKEGKGMIMYWLGTESLLNWVRFNLSQIHNKANKAIPRKSSDGSHFRLSYSGKTANQIHDKLKEIPLSFRLPRKWDLEEYWKYKEYRKNRELKDVTE